MSGVAVKQEASAEKQLLEAQRKKCLTDWLTSVDTAVAAVYLA